MADQVEIQTTLGTFSVELYDRHAPRTCKNFAELAKRGYYNGTVVGSKVQCSLGRYTRLLKVLC